MDFEIRHELAASARKTWDLVFSEDFELLLDAEQTNIQRKVLSSETKNGITIRTTHMRIDQSLPPLVAKVIGSDGLGYTLEERADPEALRMFWTVIPDRLADRLEASGDYRLADDSNGCTRIVRGSVTANIPVVGRKIEKLIADELRASYDRGAILIAQLFREQQS